MPELPEVTVITQQLDKKLRGLVLESIEYDWPKKFYWGEFSITDLRGMVVKSVERQGKVVLINLQRLSGNQVIRLSGKKNPGSQKARQPENLTILIHLKLTGHLICQFRIKLLEPRLLSRAVDACILMTFANSGG